MTAGNSPTDHPALTPRKQSAPTRRRRSLPVPLRKDCARNGHSLRPPPGAELDRSRLSAKRIAVACERFRGVRVDMTTIAQSIPEPSAASLVAFVLSYFMAWSPVRPPVRAPTPESFGFGNPETTRSYFHQIPDGTHV